MEDLMGDGAVSIAGAGVYTYDSRYRLEQRGQYHAPDNVSCDSAGCDPYVVRTVGL